MLPDQVSEDEEGLHVSDTAEEAVCVCVCKKLTLRLWQVKHSDVLLTRDDWQQYLAHCRVCERNRPLNHSRFNKPAVCWKWLHSKKYYSEKYWYIKVLVLYILVKYLNLSETCFNVEAETQCKYLKLVPNYSTVVKVLSSRSTPRTKTSTTLHSNLWISRTTKPDRMEV